MSGQGDRGVKGAGTGQEGKQGSLDNPGKVSTDVFLRLWVGRSAKAQVHSIVSGVKHQADLVKSSLQRPIVGPGSSSHWILEDPSSCVVTRYSFSLDYFALVWSLVCLENTFSTESALGFAEVDWGGLKEYTLHLIRSQELNRHCKCSLSRLERRLCVLKRVPLLQKTEVQVPAPSWVAHDCLSLQFQGRALLKHCAGTQTPMPTQFLQIFKEPYN